MTDNFSSLPTGSNFKKGNLPGGINKKLSNITRYGEANIIHDKVDIISKILGKYDTYIRRGGMNRFQRLAAARDIKKIGELSMAQYKMVQKIIANYSSENKQANLAGKTDKERKKMLAKQSGIRSRVEDFDKEFGDESGDQTSALKRRYGSSGFASQVPTGKYRISATQKNDDSFNPFRFAREKGNRSSIRKKLRSGGKVSGRDFQQIGVSALSFGGKKGASARIGVNKPSTGFTFANKNNSASSSSASGNNSFKKPLGF
jgi:hypothetical protein